MTKDELLGFAKKELVSGEEFHMRVFAFNETEKFSTFVFGNYRPEFRNVSMQALGKTIATVVPTATELVLISDTFFFNVDLKKKYPEDEETIIKRVRFGELRLENLPEKYKKFRQEALIIVSVQKNGEGQIRALPYTRIGKIIEFKEEQPLDQLEEFHDNLLSQVWKGFKDAQA